MKEATQKSARILGGSGSGKTYAGLVRGPRYFITQGRRVSVEWRRRLECSFHGLGSVNIVEGRG